jgi:hypothetical protein
MKKIEPAQSERDALLRELAAAERDFDNHYPADRVGRDIILEKVRALEARIAALDARSEPDDA